MPKVQLDLSDEVHRLLRVEAAVRELLLARCAAELVEEGLLGGSGSAAVLGGGVPGSAVVAHVVGRVEGQVGRAVVKREESGAWANAGKDFSRAAVADGSRSAKSKAKGGKG
jgi:hypothetical protein